MASPFAKYQSEQVQQLAPGFVEAYGRAGESIGQGIASIGKNVAQGIQLSVQRGQEEAKLKGSLAPYLAKDKAKVEAGVKFGSLIKNPDGTVAINPESPNKDMLDTSAIEFYNQTGGDINKMEGTDLTRFAASFESKKKIEAMEREAETNKVDLEYKRAQTTALLTKAKLDEFEMGQTQGVFSNMGFANSPYTSGTAGSTIPTVSGSPTAPGAVVTPNLSSYTGTGSKLDTNGLPSLDSVIGSSADFKAKLTRGSTPAAAPAPVAAAATKPADNVDSIAKEVGMTKESLLEASRISGVTPQEHLANFRSVAAAAAKPANSPAAVAANAPKETTNAPVSSALTAGTKPIVASGSQAAAPTVAQTPITSGQFAQSTTAGSAPAPAIDVPAIAAQVQENVTKLTETRNSLSKERDAKVAAAEIEGKANISRTRIPGKNAALASMVLSYQKDITEGIRKHYDSQIATVDSNIKLEESRLTTAKAASGAVKASAEESRAVITAAQSKKAADRKDVEDARSDLAKYPQIGPFFHAGNDLISRGKEPSKFGINALEDANQRNEVRQLGEGWIKSTDFIINMDDTLTRREELGQDYAGRMRLFTDDLNNWATGELQQIFGVATFRKAIVSGGNFSDSDRIFVQRAIAYINSLDPINDKDVYKAQIDSLAKFVDNMYRKGLNGYDMNFSPDMLIKKAERLEKEGEPEAAAHFRNQAESSTKFMERFGISYQGRDKFDQSAVDAARSILWGALDKKGLLKDADKPLKNSDGTPMLDIDGKPIILRKSAPKSK